MEAITITHAAILKCAASTTGFELNKSAKFSWEGIKEFAEDVDPQIRDAAIGLGVGGLTGGLGGIAAGKGFLAPALGGAALGAAGGYFRKPIWDALSPHFAKKEEGSEDSEDSEDSKETEEKVKTAPKLDESTDDIKGDVKAPLGDEALNSLAPKKVAPKDWMGEAPSQVII